MQNATTFVATHTLEHLLSSIISSSGFRVHAQETAPRIIHHPSDVVVKVGNPATLSCRADGSPEPTIEWLRNGQPLQTVMEDSQSQALILSDGSLFFLSASGGRRGQSHEGIYTCVARNSAGKATSRNASLYIAGKIGACMGIIVDYCRMACLFT